jgi:hypothetical protein
MMATVQLTGQDSADGKKGESKVALQPEKLPQRNLL